MKPDQAHSSVFQPILPIHDCSSLFQPISGYVFNSKKITKQYWNFGCKCAYNLTSYHSEYMSKIVSVCLHSEHLKGFQYSWLSYLGWFKKLQLETPLFVVKLIFMVTDKKNLSITNFYLKLMFMVLLAQFRFLVEIHRYYV